MFSYAGKPVLVHQSVPREAGHLGVWRLTGVPPPGGPPLHRPNRLKTRTALKTEMNGHEKLVLSNHPPKSAPAHLVAGRQVFLIFSAVFAIFSRSNVSKRVLKDNKYVLTCWETCISPSKCPERGGTFPCIEAWRGSPQG